MVEKADEGGGMEKMGIGRKKDVVVNMPLIIVPQSLEPVVQYGLLELPQQFSVSPC